jgi:hypothetical protein
MNIGYKAPGLPGQTLSAAPVKLPLSEAPKVRLHVSEPFPQTPPSNWKTFLTAEVRRQSGNATFTAAVEVNQRGSR